MAFAATCVWECRTTGSDANGGGFDPTSGTPGTDYSFQDSAQIAYTDLVIDGTTNTKCTSALNPFTAAHVGNIINVTGGTGFTVQRVQVTSVTSGAATVDKSLGTLGSTGGTGNLGGALATPGKAGGLMVAGNDLYIKSGTYSITSASSNVASGCLTLPAGTTVNTSRVIGYQTTRGDAGTRPLLQASGIATFTIVTGAAFTYIANLSLDGASLTSSQGINAVFSDVVVYKCKVANCTNLGVSGSITGSSCYFCEATGCSAGGFRNGVYYGCVAYANTSAGFSLTSSSVCINCLSVNNTGASSDGFTLSTRVNCNNCTAYGNGRDGFRGSTSTTAQTVLINCLATGNTGWQFNTGTAACDNTYLITCAGKADGSGTYNTTNFAAEVVSGFITLTADPFTSTAGSDFSLNHTASGGLSCRLAGILGAFPGLSTTSYQDIGAVQSVFGTRRKP